MGGYKTWDYMFSLIPLQYQGYAFIGFMILSFIAIGYGFYIIASDKRVGTTYTRKNTRISRKKK
jgi:hypothetical protein